MNYVVFIGRVLFSMIFLISGIRHFTEINIHYGLSHGVPMPHLAVPLAGIISLIGGISVLLGYKARYGAGLLALMLIPVTVVMHRFWIYGDPNLSDAQLVMFFKNVSLIGAALMITYFGPGPISFDED